VSEKPRGESKLWRKVLLGAALALVLLLLAAGGWLGANLLLKDPQPALLWTEADLPALPPAPDNGWLVFSNKRLGNPNVSSSLTALCDGKAHPSALAAWQEARKLRGDVVAVVSDRGNEARIDGLREAYLEPQFRDACPLDIEADCPWIPLLRTHQLVELSLLDRAMDGHFEEAFTGADLLARGDLSFVVSSRTLVSQMVGFAIVRRMMSLVDVLLAGYEDELAADRPVSAKTSALESIRKRLSTLDPVELSMRRSLIGEYQMVMRTLDLVEQSPSAAGIGGRWEPLAGLLYDRGATQRMFNDEYRSLMEFVEVPGKPEPVSKDPTQQWGWWFRNPVGKQWHGLTSVMAPMLARGKEDADDVILLSDAVIKRLAERIEAERARAAPSEGESP